VPLNLNPFRHRTAKAAAAPPKPTPAAPVHRPAEPPPRAWSLLLPPGFDRDRR